jgi:hypothetical protein
MSNDEKTTKTLSTPFTVDYFIEKFSNIPEERWAVGTFEDAAADKMNPKYDAQAFCGVTPANKFLVFNAKTIHEVPYYLHEAWSLVRLFGRGDRKVSAVNNGTTKAYPQKTPKQRILACLADIKRELEQTAEQRSIENKIRELEENA